jgi:hypothetical protein
MFTYEFEGGQGSANKRETPSHEEICKVLNGLQMTVPTTEISNCARNGSEDRDATELAVYGVFRMWKIQNPTGSKTEFMSIVERAIQ